MTEEIKLEVFLKERDRKEAESIIRILGSEEIAPRFKIRLRTADDGIKADILAKDAVAARTAINALLRNYKLICDLRDL